jgi:hypothetical protein
MARHSIGFDIRRLRARDATLAESRQAGFTTSAATWNDALRVAVSFLCAPDERY